MDPLALAVVVPDDRELNRVAAELDAARAALPEPVRRHRPRPRAWFVRPVPSAGRIV